MHLEVADDHLSFRNIVNQAEALEFLVRVTHYICSVSNVMKTNEKYWHFGFGFEWDSSSKFTDQLIDKLQVEFDSRRHRTMRTTIVIDSRPSVRATNFKFESAVNFPMFEFFMIRGFSLLSKAGSCKLQVC